MRIIFSTLIFIVAIMSFAADVELIHDVRERHVKHGVVKLIAKPAKVRNGELSDTFEFIVRYQFKTKIFLFPKLSGERIYTLPVELLDSDFYRRIREDKLFKNNDISIKYVGNKDIGRFYDAIVLHVRCPKQKFLAKVIYHPDVPGIGFVYMKSKIYGIPVVGTVDAESYLPEIRHQLGIITGR